MRILMLVIFLAGVAFAPSESFALDSVTIRINSGYPSPGAVSGHADYVVTGSAEGKNDAAQKHKDYFAKVGQLILDGNIPHHWGMAVIDSATVDISIQLGDEQFKLFNTYNDNRLYLAGDESASNLRITANVQKIIDLTIEEIGGHSTHP
jgi:hypothetical protein